MKAAAMQTQSLVEPMVRYGWHKSHPTHHISHKPVPFHASETFKSRLSSCHHFMGESVLLLMLQAKQSQCCRLLVGYSNSLHRLLLNHKNECIPWSSANIFFIFTIFQLLHRHVPIKKDRYRLAAVLWCFVSVRRNFRGPIACGVTYPCLHQGKTGSSIYGIKLNTIKGYR